MDWLKLIAAILVCQGAGALGARFTVPALSPWYASLHKPSFNPPNWIFGPVWTVLYLMMAIALYLVWQRGLHNPEVRLAVWWFGIQLAFNVLWSYLFFGLRSPWYGLIDIVGLWVSIATCAMLFSRIVPAAGWLMLPYLLWVTFAAVLNYSLWQLNRIYTPGV